LYACKIKETTNGRWSGACGEARQALEIVIERTIAQNGELNERTRAAQDGEDEAQGEADTKEQEKVEVPSSLALSKVWRRVPDDECFIVG
jgi:hypothetical protein